MDTVDELAARVEAEAGTPADRLRVAIGLSHQLTGAADALVERFVVDARRAGMSWAEIGDLFGTSRQAAQQRYAQTSALVGVWPGRWTPAARGVLDRAGEQARRLGHAAVGTEHVLLELVGDDGLAAEVLAALGVTGERILAQGCLERRATGREESCLGVRPRLKRALEHARRFADRLGHQAADSEHLLAGLLAVPDCLAVEILARCGVEAGAARAALAARLDRNPSTLSPPRGRRRLARAR
jgi:Clp amino terminal domain, pathogenicity island component